MVTRIAKRNKERKKWEERQFEKHRRFNKHFAKPGTHEFVIVLDNLKPSFNIGKIFRSADAFGAHEVHLIGTDYFHLKAAKGAFKWVPAHFYKNFDDCYKVLEERGYSFFILDPGAENAADQVRFKRKSAFIFGHEEHGISFDQNIYPDIQSMKIQQFGKVESLNVSIAASVVMYEYVRQFYSDNDF